MTEYIQVLSTVGRREDAEAVAREVVGRRLAACVQILGPVTSTYRWKSNIETAEEWLCLAKTRAELFPALEAAIKSVHPYENPEIIATPIASGSLEYLSWVAAETAQARAEPEERT